MDLTPPGSYGAVGDVARVDGGPWYTRLDGGWVRAWGAQSGQDLVTPAGARVLGVSVRTLRRWRALRVLLPVWSPSRADTGRGLASLYLVSDVRGAVAEARARRRESARAAARCQRPGARKVGPDAGGCGPQGGAKSPRSGGEFGAPGEGQAKGRETKPNDIT